MKFTFDNHSRSVDKAREVVQRILGDNLKAVKPGTNDVRVSVETVNNITGDQQNSIAKALSQLPKVAEAANIPAKKVEAAAVVVPETPVVETPVTTPADPVVETAVVETAVVETPVVETPTEPEAPVPAPTHVVVVPGT